MQGVSQKPAAYIAMASEVLEELDLTQSALGQDLLAEYIGHLLDRDALVALVVDSGAIRSHEESLVGGLPMHMSPAARGTTHSPHDSVGSLAQLFGHGVALIHDEVLVEDLEDLSTLQIRHLDCLEDILVRVVFVLSDELRRAQVA